MTVHVTVSGNSVRVIGLGDVTQDEWGAALIQHGLLGRDLMVLDYRMSDDDEPLITHEWVMELTDTDTTVRVSA